MTTTNHDDALQTTGILYSRASENFYNPHRGYHPCQRWLRSALLFYPGDILLPDSYLFTSNNIRHLEESRGFEMPLLAEALKHRHITLLSRSAKSRSLTELLDRIRHQGVIGPYSLNTARDLADRLDSQVRGSIKALPWRPQMGVTFKDRVVSSLQITDDEFSERISRPEFSETQRNHLKNFFHGTRRWRYDYIKDAIAMRKEGEGVRLIDIVNVAARDLFGRNRREFLSIYTFVSALRTGSKEQRNAAAMGSIFFRVLSDLYNLNFARRFNALCDRPGHDYYAYAFCDLPEIMRLREEKEGDVKQSSSEAFMRTRIGVPPPEAIFRWKSSMFMEARQSDEFLSYVGAYENWRHDMSNDDSKTRLVKAMKTYSRLLVKSNEGNATEEMVELGRNSISYFNPDEFRDRMKEIRNKYGTVAGVAGLMIDGVRLFLSEGLSILTRHGKEVVQFGLSARTSRARMTFYANGVVDLPFVEASEWSDKRSVGRGTGLLSG